MCFSETASYVVATACASAGVFAVYKSPSPKYLPLAIIPLAFAVQQAAEGLVWHSLVQNSDGPVLSLAPSLFVFFATVLWPIYVPLAVLSAEEASDRRRIIAAFVLIGGLVSLFYFARLFNADVVASFVGSSIQYTTQVSSYSSIPSWLLAESQDGWDWMLVPYAMATIGSLACSTFSSLRLFSAIVALALGVVMLLDHTTLVSVWCFFAASGSLLVLPAIQDARLRSMRVADRAAIASI